MRMAHRKETRYEYQNYEITITHYFQSTHGIEIVDPWGHRLEVEETILDTENMAVITAQDYIEKDMLERADKKQLGKAIHQSIKKWQDIRHFIEIPVDNFVNIVLSDATDICGFCEEYHCSQCPVRTKCRTVDQTFDRLRRQYEWCILHEKNDVCMTEDEWLATLYDIIDDILEFLYDLQNKYLT